jgi:hypothetical protein
MSEADEKPNLRMTARGIYEYAVHIERLYEHIDTGSTGAERTAELLGRITPLENVNEFENIGAEAREWEEGIIENYNFAGLINSGLNSDDKENIKEAIVRWKTQFKRRLDDDFLVFTPDSDVPTNKLIEGISGFIDNPEVEKSIEEHYQDVAIDFNQSCHILLAGGYTGSEFLALRSVEGILREWYSNKTDEEKNYTDWYSALDDLSDEEELLKEISLLDYLRERRNEVAHPDRHSEKQDAEITVQQSAALIEKIVRKLE